MRRMQCKYSKPGDLKADMAFTAIVLALLAMLACLVWYAFTMPSW